MLQDRCSWEEKSAGSRNYQVRIAAGTRSPAGGDFSVEKNAKSEVAAALRWEPGIGKDKHVPSLQQGGSALGRG